MMMEFAETECAHALLQLAVSAPRSPFPNHQVAPLNRSLDNSEIVKRIRLDHNYIGLVHTTLDGSTRQDADNRPFRNKSSVNRPSMTGESEVCKIPHTAKIGPSDLYEPSDRKFINLHLLLNCLCDDSPRVSRRRRSYSSPALGGTATVPCITVEEGHQFRCANCRKEFTKRRYLTKHIRRMHPAAPSPAIPPSVPVLCPNCGVSVPRHCFQRHSTGCHMHLWKTKRQLEVDLANCQFCGVRMRRHVLVRHLATEHCIEKTSQDEDDESSSDGGDATDGELVRCPLCGATGMSRSQLMLHLTQSHWVEQPREAALDQSLLKAILGSTDTEGAEQQLARPSLQGSASFPQLSRVTDVH